jgi:hypothetical protein
MRPTVIKTGVNMRKADINQRICLVDMRGSYDCFHRELHGLALLPIQPGLIKLI